MYIGYKQTVLTNNFTEREDKWFLINIGDLHYTDLVVNNIKDYLFNRVTPFVGAITTRFLRERLLVQFLNVILLDEGNVNLISETSVINVNRDQVIIIDYDTVLQSTGVLDLSKGYNRVIR